MLCCRARWPSPSALQFDRSDYGAHEETHIRDSLNHVQYVSYLKSTSDADRGKSNFHGVSKRGKGKWQSRITSIAVRIQRPNV
jgi:hypothetical protein